MMLLFESEKYFFFQKKRKCIYVYVYKPKPSFSNRRNRESVYINKKGEIKVPTGRNIMISRS